MNTSSKLKKVAILQGSFSGGGSERAMINFSHGLARKGIHVDMLATTHQGPFRSLVSDEINMITIGKGMLSGIPKIRSYLKQHQPQILFGSQAHVNIAAILSKLGLRCPTKVVIREATTPSEYLKNQLKFKKRAIMYACKKLFRRADHVIAVGDDSRQDCISYYKLNPENISTVYSPFVNDDLFDMAAEPVSHPWFEQGARVIISMGRVMPVKDFSNLVNAFSKIRSQIQCKLMILGETTRDPECFQRVQGLVSELKLQDDVEFVGFKKNPFPYVNNSEVYVLSSKFEGMPGSLVQGMALGCKLVATDCRSGPREVLAGGKRGQLVPVGDSDALAAALIKAFEINQDRSIGREWSKEFSEDFSINKLIEVFENLI